MISGVVTYSRDNLNRVSKNSWFVSSVLKPRVGLEVYEFELFNKGRNQFFLDGRDV